MKQFNWAYNFSVLESFLEGTAESSHLDSKIGSRERTLVNFRASHKWCTISTKAEPPKPSKIVPSAGDQAEEFPKAIFILTTAVYRSTR